ncbi:flippase [Vibrio diabolicus]|uniref:flippase n=1 Tax=Vibrio diabolicus TaxID=50719 RepID=UPI002494EA6B|nr:flippase [Vibrio diabolicus]
MKKLNIKNDLKKIIYNSFWLFSEKLFKIFLGFTVSIWVAKYLGPTHFGELTYAITVIGFFQVLSKFGLDTIIVRELSNKKFTEGVILGTAFRVRLIAGGLSCFVCLLTAYISGQHNYLIHMIILSPILLSQSLDIIDLKFQSNSKSKYTVRIKYVTYILSNSLRVMAILLEFDVSIFLAIFMLELLLVSILLRRQYVKNKVSDIIWSFDQQLFYILIKESWPYMVSGISILLYMRIDQVFIKGYLEPYELGIYAVVLPLSTFWQFVPVTLVTSLAPYIARKKDESEYEYYKSLYNSFRFFNLFSLSLCVSVTFLGNHIMGFIYGNQYPGAGEILTYHIWTNYFICFGMVQSLWILNEKKSKLNLYKTIAGALVCLLGNYFVIDRFGLIGVAWVAVVSQFSATLISDFFLARKMFFYQLRSVLFLKFKLLQ